MPFLMFLTKYWKYIVSILLILIVFGYWKSLTTTIKHQNAQIVQYQVDAKVQEANILSCTNANQSLQGLITEMNETNLKLNNLNTKMSTSLNDLLKTVKRQAEDIKKKNDALAAVPWDRLDCPQQVDACYEILRSQP